MKKISGLLIATLFAAGSSIAAQPNMVLLFVDDLGYADVGYNGCTDIPTPHIDSIASNGVICDKGYVSTPRKKHGRTAEDHRLQNRHRWQMARRPPTAIPAPPARL